jgi:Flp pilus assembly protein TadB
MRDTLNKINTDMGHGAPWARAVALICALLSAVCVLISAWTGAHDATIVFGLVSMFLGFHYLRRTQR